MMRRKHKRQRARTVDAEDIATVLAIFFVECMFLVSMIFQV